MSIYLLELNDEMATIAGHVQQSLVQIACGGRSGGAGVVWSPGRIVTNAHVLRGEPVEVTFCDGRVVPVELLAADRARDVALLAADTAGISSLERGDSRRLRPGDWILAAGHPWGIAGAASAGSVIATGRPAEGSGYPGELLQVGLHLRPGHSGGPMVDAGGRLVGLNSMIAGPDVGLAVPIHVIEEFLREMGEDRAAGSGYI